MIKEKNIFINLAQKALQKGDIDQSIYEYQSVLKLDPEDLQVHNVLGDLFTRKNKIQEAIKEYMFVAEKLRDKGFFLKAVALYKKVSRLDPKLPGPYEKMAELYLDLKLPAEARANYQLMIDYYRGMRNNRKVIEIFRKLCGLEPENIIMLVKLAQMCVNEGMNIEASVEYLKIGAEYFKKNEIKEAAEYFEKATELNPACFTGYKWIGKCYFSEGELDKAIPLIEKSLSINPNDLDSLMSLAKSFYRSGLEDKAINTFEKILNIDPSLTTIREKLANLYLEKGIADKALIEFKKVIDDFINRKDFKEALTLLDDIKDKIIFDNELRENLILVLRTLGEKERLDEFLRSIPKAKAEVSKIRTVETPEEKSKEKPPEPKFVEAGEDDSGEKGLEEVEKLLEKGLVDKALEELEHIEEEKEIPVKEEKVYDFKSKFRAKDEEEEVGDFFDLGESLKKDLGLIGEKDSDEREDYVGGDELLEEVFDQFKKAIDKEIASEDYSTHYNLGLAYMEMELFEDAIKEFHKTLKNPALLKSHDRRYLDCCSLLANCFIRMGLFHEALWELEKGLNRSEYEARDYVPLKFSKGIAFENLRKYQDALRLYNEVLAADPGHKDAENKIKEIKNKVY